MTESSLVLLKCPVEAIASQNADKLSEVPKSGVFIRHKLLSARAMGGALAAEVDTR